MVKLRSRLIRSPFSGSGAAGESSVAEGRSSDNNNSQQQSRGRNSRRNPGRQPARSNRSPRQQQPPDEEGEADEHRQPFEELDTAAEQQQRRRGWSRSRSRSRSAVTSPGKRKPESRGITASIRRAKTAMLRMASSPMHSSSRNAEGEAGEETNAAAGTVGAAARMDADRAMEPEAGEATTRRALNFQGSPSEENVPPLALLSPNCGTLYAHAAGASFVGQARREDSTAMDVDDACTAEAKPAAAKNVLEWMKEDAPPELLPKLLSFCGSRQANALSRTCKAWNATVKDEGVWRVMCEDTRKWSEGDDVPNSWARYYRRNPVVPIDYDTVESALDAVSSGTRHDALENNVRHSYREQRETCRVLLHPGPYFLRRPLVANVIGNAELTIEAVEGSNDPEHGVTWRRNYHKSSPTSGTAATPRSRTASEDSASSSVTLPGDYEGARNARRPSSPTLRQIFGSCGPRSSFLGALDVSRRSVGLGGGSSHPNDEEDDDVDSPGQAANRLAFHQSCFRGRPTPLLCLESRRKNEPVVRVRQGAVTLRGIKFVHYCEGIDIWNGNAAIQVQRAFGADNRPLRVEPPRYVAPVATVEDCHVTSFSGRGLVVIDGALARVTDCNFHGSAATGVYVGGGGSAATLTRTDVVDNGTGNARVPPGGQGGVARGHSGVYVEQGLARLVDCNVSGNTLTGLSAVSTEQAQVHMEDTDVRGNRSDQVELPPVDSGRCVTQNNAIGRTGTGRPRSRRLSEMYKDLETPRGRRSAEHPRSPQSPLED